MLCFGRCVFSFQVLIQLRVGRSCIWCFLANAFLFQVLIRDTVGAAVNECIFLSDGYHRRLTIALDGWLGRDWHCFDDEFIVFRDNRGGRGD